MAKTTRANGPAGGYDALRKRIADIKALQAEAGWFSSSVYPDGTPAAYVATVHEFGVPEKNIPSRSFWRVAQEKYGQGWAVLMGKGALRVMEGKMTAQAMYDALGVQAAGDIRETLARGTYQKLADATVAARARKRQVPVDAVNKDPLHDTGYLQATLNNQTRPRGTE